jgi:hypothetical protein
MGTFYQALFNISKDIKIPIAIDLNKRLMVF